MNTHMDGLNGCIDCLVYIANGDIPENRPGLATTIAERFPDGHIVTACEENCEGWFSWRFCDICGSHEAGERHPFVVLCDHKACA